MVIGFRLLEGEIVKIVLIGYLLVVGFFLQAQGETPYQKVLKTLDRLHSLAPQRTKIFDLGKNDQGKTIFGMSVYPPKKREGEFAEALVVAAHHGNEQGSVDVALTILKRLIENNSSKIQNKIIHVVPVLNISGFNNGMRQEKSEILKTTLDPNRDYPDTCAPQKKSFQLRSTALLAQFMSARKRISSAVTIHGYIGTFTFPWGNYLKNTESKDHQFYEELLSFSAKENGYRIGTHADVIYPAEGAFEDWTYSQWGIWTSLLELDNNYDRDRDSSAVIKYIYYSPNLRSAKKQEVIPARDCLKVRGSSSARP